MGKTGRIILIILAILALCGTVSCGNGSSKDFSVALCTNEKEIFEDPGINNYYSLEIQRQNDAFIRLLATRTAGYNIYIQKEDHAAELVLENVQIESLVGGFVDELGKYVLYGRNDVAIYDEKGAEEVYFGVKQNIRQIVPAEKNKYYVLASEGGHNNLYELNIVSQKLDKIPIKMKSNEFDIGYLCMRDEKVGLAGNFGLYILDVDREKYRKVFDLEGSTFSFSDKKNQIVSIELFENNKLNVFTADGLVKTLEYVDVGKTREVIRLRAGRFRNEPLLRFVKDVAEDYNSTNGKYYVLIDEYDVTSENYDAYSTKTNTMISSGEVDILFLNANNYDSEDLLRDGKLLDLQPYLDKNGIEKDEYYPIVFNAFETDVEGIYGVNLSAWGEACAVNPDYVSVERIDELSLEMLLSCLEQSENDIKLTSYQSKSDETMYFLDTSKSLFGSVDWETKTCEFSNEKFKHFVTSVERFPSEGTDFAYAMGRMIFTPKDFISLKEAAKEDNLLALPGVFFDEGIYPVFTDGDELVIPNNSEHKEAAADFISYLLSDDIQRMLPDYYLGIGKRSVDIEYTKSLIGTEVIHTTINPKLLNELNKIATSAGTDAMFQYQSDNKTLFERTVIIDEEAMDEFIQTKDRIRPYPLRNNAIINMIGEELETFYSGEKTFGEVCDILNKRVGTYLSEHYE